MAAAAHDAGFANRAGIKQSVAKEFNKADTGTKQLSNAMKNKPKKRLSEELAETKKPRNGGTKKMDPSQHSAMKNSTTLPGLNMSTGSAYMNYRMGIALAGAPDYPTKMEADNWVGGDPLISSYTEEEFNMVKAAAKLVGAGTIQNWSGDRSKEMADTQKASPIAKPKRNKYGV